MAEVCKEVRETIKEEIERRAERQEQRCKKWPWPLSWICSLVVTIVTWIEVIYREIVYLVCEIVVTAWNFVGYIANFILALPLIGPLFRFVMRGFMTVVSYGLGLLDGAGRAFGLRLTKRLRVWVIPLCRGNSPLVREANLRAVMKQTADTLYNRAQIRVITRYMEPIRNPPEDALRIGTEGDLIADELWLKGSWFQLQANKIFDSNAARLFGIGHPVIVFVVEEVGYDGQGNTVGCSAGPFIDWIAVEALSVADQVNAANPSEVFPPTVAGGTPAPVGMPNRRYAPYVVAHEICHALGLLGHANAQANELMWPKSLTGDALSPLQVGIIRSSPHVTYI